MIKIYVFRKEVKGNQNEVEFRELEKVGFEKYYYDTYFGYNPNYFVIVLDNDADETAVTSDSLFTTSHASTSRTKDATNPYEYDNMLKATGTLTINKKSVALYVNTSYFTEGLEIYYVGQNTNAPSLPTINNALDLDYNLFNGIGYPAGDREAAVYPIPLNKL